LDQPSSRVIEASAEASLPLVSVLIPHYNLGAYLGVTVDSALASDYPNLELVVVDDASTDASGHDAMRDLEARGDARIRVIKLPVNCGLAATRNVAVQHARGDFALALDADDLIDSQFISIAARALMRNPDVSFVVPQTAYFDDGEQSDPAHDAWPQCMTFVGEARASGLLQNRFSTATIMGRTDALRALRYDESLKAYEDWEMYLRAVMARRRFLVTNAVHFYYRRRRNSMIHSPEAARRVGFFYHDIVRSKQFVLGENRLPMYVLEGASGASHGESVAHLRARLAVYENSAFVAAALAIRGRVGRLPVWVQRGARLVLGVVRARRR
jgi:glycosyltransferase involved in cell wall biosynthesis